MSITYEEALSTLQAMFGPPWTQETLDAVLRHHKGHMENTVESILGHGSGDPDDLIRKLRSPNDIDEQIAQQLAREGAQGSSAAAPPSATPPAPSSQSTKGRGTPTTLPPDFLRIPGYHGDAGVRTPEMDQDEQLARMLQDELFSQELANNPEFAHLARPRTVGGRPTNAPGRGRGRVGELPSRTGSVSGRGSQPPIQGAEIMAKVSEMGESAKRRFRMFAAQFNQRVAGATGQNPPPAGSGGAGGTTGAAAERRGLLDGDGGDSDDGMEMAFGGKKDL